MKKNILLITILLSTGLFAQDILWERSLGGKHAEILSDAIATPDYGFFIAGSSLSKKVDKKENAGDYDYLIAKLNEQGKVEYSKSFGGSGTDLLQSIYKSKDGGYLLCGTSDSPISGDKTLPNLGKKDIWLLKLDVYGQISWQKVLGGFAEDKAEIVINTSDGGFLIGGSSASDSYAIKDKNFQSYKNDIVCKTGKNRGNLDYWIVKLDAGGKVSWQKTLGGKYVDEIRSIIEVTNGQFVVGGVSNSPMSRDKDDDNKGMNDWWLIGIDENGQVLWQRTYATDGDEQLYSLVLSQDNTFIAGGSISSASGNRNNSKSDFLLVKYDLEGEKIWERRFDFASHDIMTNLVQNKDGSFLLSGYVKPSGKVSKVKKGINDYVVIKIDQNGEEEWRQSVGTHKKEVLKHSIETRDGGYVLLGTQYTENSHNNADFWAVKLLDTKKEKHEKKAIEAMPNPAVDHTMIVVKEDYHTGSVRIVDFNGRILKQFSIEGSKMFPVNTQNLPIGIYIVHVKTDVQESSVKIIKK